jgi:hypothetical protein
LFTSQVHAESVSNDASRRADPHALDPVSAQELPGILAAHQAYVSRQPGGRRASLKFRDLSGLDLSGCQLSEADLSGASLKDCHMVRANLRGANLFGAELTRVDLTEAILVDADMRGVAMSDAKLVRTDLTRVDLRDGLGHDDVPCHRDRGPAGASPDVQFFSQPS